MKPQSIFFQTFRCILSGAVFGRSVSPMMTHPMSDFNVVLRLTREYNCLIAAMKFSFAHVPILPSNT